MTPELKNAIKLNPDAVEEAYNRGFNSGKEHSKSSPETKSRLKKVEDNVAEHKKMMEQLKQFTDSFQKLLDHSQQRDIKVDSMISDIKNEFISFSVKVDEMYEQNKIMFDLYKNFNIITRALIFGVKWSFYIITGTGAIYFLFKKFILGIY